MSIRFSVCLATGLLLTSVTAQAMPVTVNLGESSETFVEYGLGPNSENLGTFAFDQGSCVFDGTNTTCTLSGAFSGSAPPLSSGTYTLVTQYGGNDRTTALVATSIAAEPNFFSYTTASPSTTITLNLDTGSGTDVRRVVAGGGYDPAVTGFAFTLVPPYKCSGVAVNPCTQEAVGLTNGAILQSRVTTVVSFGTSRVGDCDGSGAVTISDLITILSIALGNASTSTCEAGDQNGDGAITIDEIIAAVGNAIDARGAE